MYCIARNTFLALCFLALSVQAQIPPQPGANPNTIPPPGGARPFNRPNPGNPNGFPPGAVDRPNAAVPGGAAPGEPKPAIKPEDAIKEDGGVELQFPNTPLSQILLVYEDLTGLKIIRDANVEQATVSIETTGELPKEKAIMFIEKSLLLNGYAFVPSGDGMVKILAFDAKKPQTEGAPFFESAMDLPMTDQVVNFVIILKYLNGEDAIKAIDQVIPRHIYGVITAVPNAKALVVTENSNTVRAIIALLERLDTKPAETKQKTFQMVRSDAEDIKKALDEILGTDEKNSGSGGGGRTPSIPQNQVGSIPGQPIQPQIPGGNSGISVSNGGGSSAAQEVPPKIISIARRNCLLVVATAETMDYIGKLIEELDAASEIRNFISRPLVYLSVESAMSIISDAISRTEGGEGGEGGGAGNTSNPNSQNQNQNSGRNNQSNSGGLFGNNNSNGGGFGNSGGGLGGGGIGGSSGGGFGGGGGNLQPLRQNNGPQSMVVGKTLLISDPTANSIFASGPPEHLRILDEIMNELDRRPQQILISAVIGDYSLGNNTGFSIETALRGRGGNKGIFGQVGASNGPPSISTNSGTTTTTSNPDARSAVSAATAFATGNALNFYGGIGSGLDVIVNTLNTNTDFKVISRPTLFTLNNTAATISSGSSFPIASSTQSNFNGGNAGNGFLSNVQYQDIVLSLNIIPLINSNDELTLQISQQNSEQSGTTSISGNDYPTLTKQELNTTVICKNNGTVLLGGLIREEKVVSHSGLPFLSKIPVLRLLSGSRSKSNRQRELVIMIQPTIVNDISDIPPNTQLSPGTSPFSDETRAVFKYEKTQKELLNAPKAIPLDKPTMSARIRGMVEKLFY